VRPTTLSTINAISTDAPISKTFELLPSKLGKLRAPRHAHQNSTKKVYVTKPPRFKKFFATVQDLIEERQILRLTVIDS
jgi:hypothetical protein